MESANSAAHPFLEYGVKEYGFKAGIFISVTRKGVLKYFLVPPLEKGEEGGF